MESSFKKGYDKRVNPDGSFELSFKARRFSPQSATAIGVAMAFLLYPVSCAVTLPIAGLALTPRQDLFQVSKGLWTALSLGLYVLLGYFIATTTTKILVKPNLGLVLGGDNLPFKDIDRIGTHNHPGGNRKSSAFVYADTHGTQIKISKYIALELAEAVAQEIKNASGFEWKNI